MKKKILLSFLGMLTFGDAFISSTSSQKPFARTHCQLRRHEIDEQDKSSACFNRRHLIASSMGLVTLCLPTLAQADDKTGKDSDGVTVYKTASGLKYIELEEGNPDSSSPRYGQLCVIAYTAYLKLPNKGEKEKFDSSSAYVLKHGNGRMVSGLDEGLHTMKKGGLRRMIIPPKLGFVDSGLGPLPSMPWNRFKLNSLLDEMIAQRGGNLVYDIRLVNFFDDEADQGYYEDDELSAEELAELQRRLNRGGNSMPAVEALSEGQA
jgi:hypothetical protein